jgi:hypothetical protein
MSEQRLHTILPAGLFASRSYPEQRLPSEDRREIMDTARLLDYALDARRFDVISEMLTEDAVYDHPMGMAKGKENVLALLIKSEAEILDGVRHQISDIVVYGDMTGHATAVSTLEIFKFCDPDPEVDDRCPFLVGHGIIVQSFRKEQALWRISSICLDQLAVSKEWIKDAALREKFAKKSGERGEG